MSDQYLFSDPRESKRERDRRYRRKLKIDCLMNYGGCQCYEEGCTETDPDKLELHHPNGDGNKDRAERIGRGLRSPGGWNFYQKLKKEGWPPGFKVICIKHHDILHGRYKGESRAKSSPGEDPLRHDDLVPF